MDNSWENINTAGTFVLKPTKGVLKTIVVNTTAAGTVQVYDNASAASGKLIATLKSNIAEGDLNYGYEGLPFINGLVVKTNAASDLTVIYS